MSDSRLLGDLNRGRLLVRLVTFGIPLVLGMFFHSLFNLIGIVIFLPSIGFMSRELAKRYGNVSASLLRHIRDSDLGVPEAAVENMSRETMRLITYLLDQEQRRRIRWEGHSSGLTGPK